MTNSTARSDSGLQGHTPGPWLRIDKEDYAEIHAAFRPSSQAVALVGKPRDADLIANAPDLLEALEAVTDDLEAEIEARRGAVLERTTERDLIPVRRARDIIAKARGAA